MLRFAGRAETLRCGVKTTASTTGCEDVPHTSSCSQCIVLYVLGLMVDVSLPCRIARQCLYCRVLIFKFAIKIYRVKHIREALYAWKYMTLHDENLKEEVD